MPSTIYDRTDLAALSRIGSVRQYASDKRQAVRWSSLSEPVVELGRLKWALDFVVTPGVRQGGMGQVDLARLSKHIDILTDGFQLPRKLPSALVFDPSFLPAVAERQIARQ